MIPLGVVSNGIYFITEGTVDVHMMLSQPHKLVELSSGSYFGDVSYIFRVKNLFDYVPRANSVCRIYSLQDQYL